MIILSMAKTKKKTKGKNTKKPDIVWMEGLLDFFNAPFPHKPNDPRELGFKVGRQIIGLYIVEMLLKYALDTSGVTHGLHHDLHQLFMQLSSQRRLAVERKYKQILNSRTKQTWDVVKSVDSFLRYLERDPFTDTRYFWEPNRNHVADHASIIIMPQDIHSLIYALFIVLHKYPSQPIEKRYDTKFISLKESLERDQQHLP